MPIESAVLGRYDKAYLEYETENHFKYRSIAMQSLAEAGLDPKDAISGDGRQKSILEIGCATGALLSLFKDAGWKSRGIEISPEMSGYARRIFGLDVFTGRLEDAAFEPCHFDAIVASHIIEHINRPLEFLQNSKKLLLRHGAFYIITPNADSLQASLYRQNWRSAIRDHLFLFSRATLKAMLGKAGFRVDYFGSWGGWPKDMKPGFLKKPLDKMAKSLGWGDVMIIKAVLSGSGQGGCNGE